MRIRWMLVAGLLALAFFWAVGGRGHLFAGHDHWCSGQLMLQAQSYIRAGFATPLGLPVEDAYGPIGTWAAYTGWPPLVALALAGYLKVTGPSLIAARFLACVFSSCSAVLVLWLGWRVTRHTYAALLGMLVFTGHEIVTRYCTFVCYDPPALTLTLLLIALYPAVVLGASRRALALYCALAGVGGLVSWTCYMAPPACGLALAVADRARFREHWRRAVSPLAVLFVVGILLVLAFGYVGRHYAFNPDGSSGDGSEIPVAQKLLTRMGLDNPGEALEFAYLHVALTVETSRPLLLGLLVVLAANYLVERQGLGRPPRAEGRCPGTFNEAVFYLHALWMFPTIWLVFMPNVHLHDTQMLFAVPFLAVLSAALVQRSLPDLDGRLLRIAYPAAVLACFVALAARSGVQAYRSRSDWEIGRELEADIKRLTREKTVVVMAYPNRGMWWRIGRPVVGATRLRQVDGRDHVLVVRLGATGWEKEYEVLQRRHVGGGENPEGYLILKRRACEGSPEGSPITPLGPLTADSLGKVIERRPSGGGRPAPPPDGRGPDRGVGRAGSTRSAVLAPAFP